MKQSHTDPGVVKNNRNSQNGNRSFSFLFISWFEAYPKLEYSLEISKQLVTEMINLLNTIGSFAVCLVYHSSLPPF